MGTPITGRPTSPPTTEGSGSGPGRGIAGGKISVVTNGADLFMEDASQVSADVAFAINGAAPAPVQETLF